ncbi:glycoside hydrolase family 68 protein [Leuconostoc mesenteroides]|uniref:glycoside hydrolase family 68 protein n=1 Tax=Leuconostoc mesenteroides TaxID=1245 RepID=UPI0015F54B9B|nr:glycoside hydrolase family 68 protein [Leuconostoc mesenteroides]MBA5972271.1 glycoside hydrolase family 68 protein [Leuconostoc mesenteroides]
MRKKLYKSGKLWVAAAAVTLSIATGSATVQADTVTAANATTSKTTDQESISTTTSDTTEIQTEPDDASNTVNKQEVAETVDTKNSTADITSTDNKTTTTENSTADKTANTTEKTENSADAKVDDTITTDVKTTDIKTESAEAKEVNSNQQEYQTTNIDDSISSALNSKKIVIRTNTDGTSTTQITYANFQDVADNNKNANNDTSVPYFNADAIKNIPAATTADAETSNVTELDVWDSWALQDAKTGAVENYHGYNVVFALAGRTEDNADDIHIYVFYNTYGSTALSDWRSAGPVLGMGARWESQQWSGSATVNDDGSIQLFYTQVDNPNIQQQLATANIGMGYSEDNLEIESVNNIHTVFQADGYHYQTFQQYWNGGYFVAGDQFTLRDPHVIEVDGERYLVFESNTGTENYQSEASVNNLNYFGGTDEFNQQAVNDIKNDENKSRISAKANGAIGLVKLSDDQNNPSVVQVYSPLLTTNGITDEIERANIVPLNGKYYLFTTARLNRGVVRPENNDIAGMMGYVSNSLFGPYLPLNGSGVVLNNTQSFASRTDTYSYYAVPVTGHDNLLLVTSYMTNRQGAAGEENKSTFSPSFLIEISSDGLNTKVLDTILAQGTWTYNGKGSVAELVGTKETSNITGKKIGWIDNKFYVNDQVANGYQYDYTNDANYLFKDGVRQSGVQAYDNTYYYFDPVTYKRVENDIRKATWGLEYYFGNDGRVKQGQFAVNGVAYDFGNDKTYAKRGFASGYLQDVTDNNQWYWFENGSKYTGFRYYQNTYYFFESGQRQESKWETAWGMKYYVGTDGRAVQGVQIIDGQAYDFGTNGTFNLKGTASGYLYSPSLSTANGGYNWFENGKPYTGFRYYEGTYYWFVNGVRQNAGWREAWGMKYYTDASGRALQGIQIIDGQAYDFGTNGTYNLKSAASGYLYSPSYSKANGGYNWFENGKLYTGFRYYMGTYYWFVNGVRQNAGWREAWGKKYYTDANGRALQGIQKIDGQQYNFGNDGTYYLR